ncbi:putative aspartic protease, partial [Mycena sanguinolenta]
YTVDIQVGNQTFEVMMDTGSNNTWAGMAQGEYILGPVKIDTSSSGTEYTDTVHIAGLGITDQYIGYATSSSGFDYLEGFLGLGPVDLTEGTVSGLTTVPTVMETMFAQGAIPEAIFSLSFAPLTGWDVEVNGAIDLGGPDLTKFSGLIQWFNPVINGWYWGAVVHNITYNGTSIGGAVNAVVNSGSTSQCDHHLAKFKLCDFQPTKVVIGAGFYPLTPSQFTIPPDLSLVLGLEPRWIYGWIASGGSQLILGQKFLENYYSMYDTQLGIFGFAPRA